ncbi:MAG: hypothetical protein ACJ8LG_19955 [Massilia sp.]
MTLLRRILPALSASALALALAACASAGPTPPMKQGSFRLLPQQSVELAPGATLTYDSVSDSRCPPDVKCIWAGKLAYQFSLKTPEATEAFALGPGQLQYSSPALHGASVVLDEHAIPPARASQAAPAAHAVTLKVSTR